MKKLIALVAVILLTVSSAFAEIYPHALGLRFGGGDGFGTEISYQHGLSSTTRLEADLGFFNSPSENRMRITGIHQWVWDIQGGLSWYAGVGGGLGHASKDNGGNEFILDIDGNIGIEYQFDVPLQISLDLRPTFGTSQFSGTNVGLSLRYTF